MTLSSNTEAVSDERLTTYEMQVLLGTTITGCNMGQDRVFDLKAAWSRLHAMGLIDRADGLAIATSSGLLRINDALSRRSVSNAGRVEVKALEWGETSFGTPEVATIAGVYRIVHAGNGGWCANIKGETLLDTDGRTNFATLGDAKEACQADFNQRILSAIEVRS